MDTAGLNGWHVMRWLELLVEHYAGAELHDKLNTFEESWDCEAVVQAFTKYKEWVDAGYFPDGFLTLDPNDTIMAMGTGECAMDLQSAFAEMTQFNKNLSDEELDACVKFMDYYYSDDSVDQYGEYYNLPLPKQGKKAPADQVNVDGMLETSNTNGTFTITDQAFPTEVADVLFNAQDAVANDEMTPEEAASNIQKAIEEYQAK